MWWQKDGAFILRDMSYYLKDMVAQVLVYSDTVQQLFVFGFWGQISWNNCVKELRIDREHELLFTWTSNKTRIYCSFDQCHPHLLVRYMTAFFLIQLSCCSCNAAAVRNWDTCVLFQGLTLKVIQEIHKSRWGDLVFADSFHMSYWAELAIIVIEYYCLYLCLDMQMVISTVLTL